MDKNEKIIKLLTKEIKELRDVNEEIKLMHDKLVKAQEEEKKDTVSAEEEQEFFVKEIQPVKELEIRYVRYDTYYCPPPNYYLPPVTFNLVAVCEVFHPIAAEGGRWY